MKTLLRKGNGIRQSLISLLMLLIWLFGNMNAFGNTKSETSEGSKSGLPPGWEYQTNSSVIHGIIVLLSADPRINNIPLQAGDYIGAFYTDDYGELKCGGADFWTDTSNIIFSAFKDDGSTPEKDGFGYAEIIYYKVFSWTTMKEYLVDEVSYDTQNYPSSNKWYPLGLSCVTNMACYEEFDAYATADPNPACIGNSVDLAAHIFIGTTGNYTYSWTSDPPGLNSTLQSLTVTPTQNTTYFLTVSDGLLVSNHYQTVTLIFNPTATAGSDQTICVNQNTQVSGSVTNASGLVWSTSGDGTFNNLTIPDPVYTPGTLDKANGSATLTITAQPISPCLQYPSDQLTITLEPLPTVSLPETLSFCKNQEVWVTATANNQSSVQWSTTGDGTFGNPGALVTRYYPGTLDLSAEQFTLKIIAQAIAPCTLPVSDQVNVTLTKVPTCNVPGSRTKCENVPVNTSGTASNYSVLLWTTQGDGTFDNPAVFSTNYNPGPQDKLNSGTTLTLFAYGNGPCYNSPATDDMIVILKPLPVVDAGNTPFVCSGSYLQLNATLQNYSFFTWATSGDGTFSSTTLLNPKYYPGTNDLINKYFVITLTATPVTPCTTSVSDDLQVTVVGQPTASITTQSGQSICRSSNLQLNAVATNYVGLLWSTSGDGTFSNNGVLDPVYYPGPVVDVSGSPVTLTFKAIALIGCGTDVTKTITATFIDYPTAEAGANATICQTSVHTLSATAANYSTLLWTTSGNGTFSNAAILNPTYYPGTTDISSGTVTLTLTAFAISPCTVSSSDSKVLFIQKSPTANAGSDATICQTSVYALAGSASNNSGIAWSSSGNGTFSNSAILNPVYTPGTNDISSGTVTLTLSASAVSPCTISFNDPMILTIRKTPTVNAGADATVCQTATHALSGSATNYSSVLWSTSGNGTFSNTAVLNPVYTPGTNDITNGSVILTLVANAIVPCSGSVTDTKVLVLQKSPTANAGADATICQSGTHALSGSAANHSSVQWSTSGNGTFSSASSLNAIYTPGTVDITNGSVILTLTALAVSPCTVSASDTKTLVIQKLPTANAGADATICQTATKTLNGTAANYSSLLWSTSGNGSFSSTTLLNPVYTPGTNDINSGSVTLTLSASAISPCTVATSDNMILTVRKLPTANAGADATICQGNTHHLAGAAANQASVLWSTSGNGTFTTTTILNPFYTPGSNDISLGIVTLTLTSLPASPCTVSSSDFMNLTIQKQPVANAGNDATICEDGFHALAGLVSNQTSITWSTSGNGTFSNATILNPVYFPGTSDIVSGFASITLSANAISPCTVAASDVMILTVRRLPSINAGPDATITDTETFIPSSTGSDYSSISWSTSGDGTFSNSGILNPVYSPGVADLENGYVSLEISCQPMSPCSFSQLDVLELSILRQLQFGLQAGWQGFSSFVDVSGQNIEEVFAPIADKIIVAQNGTSVYWPEYGINTIGNFINLKGYKIKLSTTSNLPVAGFVFDQKTVALPQGWSILPVLSGCSVDYTEIITQLGSKLIIINEIGGTGMIWPANGIFTIPQLMPGKAYMIKVTTECSFTYPLCGE